LVVYLARRSLQSRSRAKPSVRSELMTRRASIHLVILRTGGKPIIVPGDVIAQVTTTPPSLPNISISLNSESYHALGGVCEMTRTRFSFDRGRVALIDCGGGESCGSHDAGDKLALRPGRSTPLPAWRNRSRTALGSYLAVPRLTVRALGADWQDATQVLQPRDGVLDFIACGNKAGLSLATA
jgi:hypothetical protein